jgi:glycosyltransferase involved in cell wall biosynthesis
MPPTVTAAITTYNRAALVVEAVESVLAQAYRDYELIVVDNGSTDGTREILEPYADRIRYHHQENRGRAGARNTAVGLAAGSYVAFLDSDDLWLPDKLARQLEAFEAYPRAGLIHGQVELIAEDGRPLPSETAVHRRLFARAHRHGATYARYALECRCLTSTAMFRADVLARVGAYDPAFALEDLDLYLRVLLDSEVVFLDGAPLARYRVHASQTANEELARGRIVVLERHLATSPAQARAYVHLGLADAHHVLGDGDRAREHVLRAARLDPRVLFRPQSLRQLALSLLPRRALRRLREAL